MTSKYGLVVSGQLKSLSGYIIIGISQLVAIAVMIQEFACMCTCCKSNKHNERVKSTLEHQVGNSIDTKNKSSSLQERKDSFAATNLPTDMIATLLTQASI